jgi:hypothetical protein
MMLGLDLSDATIQFLSSFLAVLLAFGLSYWYDRREKRRRDTETRKRILTAILAEYKAILNAFASFKGGSNDQIGMPLTHFANTAVLSAIGSGELTLLNPTSQALIDQVNGILNDYQDELERLFLLIMPAPSKLGMDIFSEMKSLLHANGSLLQEQLPGIMVQLQLELDSL